MANYKRFNGLTDSILSSVKEVVTASSKSAAERKAQEVEKYAAKYESVRPQQVEKSVRPIERVYASMRPTTFAPKQESIADRVQSLVTEQVGTTPKTEKHKKLAAFAPPKDKITHADILRGRGVPAARGGSRGATTEEAVVEQEKLWPGTAAWKAKHGTDKEKHELKYGKSDVKPLKPYGYREDPEDSPMSAQTKGRGRPKKIRTEEVEELDEVSAEVAKRVAQARDRSAVANKLTPTQSRRLGMKDKGGEPDLNAAQALKSAMKRGAKDVYGEEVEELDEMGPGKLPRIDKKVENEYSHALMKDFLARGGQVKQVASPKLPKNRNRFIAKGSLSSGERTLTRSGGKSFTSRMGEEVELAKEEVEQIDELSKKTLGSYVKNAAGDLSYASFKSGATHKGDEVGADFSDDKDEVRARKREAGIEKAVKKLTKEATDTPGNGAEHQCALHVKHAKLGEGRTLFSQHAEPAEDGSIEWYDVMFEHGIERVMTAEVEILVSESHMNHKKKGK